MSKDIYKNVTDMVIFITTKWKPDPLGGPAAEEKTYCCAPGESIDITILGLRKIELNSHEIEKP